MSFKAIIIIIIFLVLIGIGGTSFYLYAHKSAPEITVKMVDLKLKCEDKFTKEPCSTKFRLENNSGYIILSGTLKYGVWNIFNGSLAAKKVYKLYVGLDDKYYTTYSIFGARIDEYRTISKMVKITEDVEITHTGSIKDNNIEINITPLDGVLWELDLCFQYTFGILDVELFTFVKECTKGAWKNYSHYNSTTKEYTWLDDGFYLCGQDELRECGNVINQYCTLAYMSVPSRLSTKVDKCYQIAKTLLANETFSTKLDVSTVLYVSDDDYLNIYIMDREDTKQANGKYIYSSSDLEGNDVGLKDIIYKINY